MYNDQTKYKVICQNCGRVVDTWSLSLLKHGWIEEDETITCYQIDVPHIGSKKARSPVEYLKKVNDAVSLN